MRRRTYSNEDKEHAVRVVMDSSRPVVALAAELGIPAATLGRWVRAHRQDAVEEAWAEQVERHFGFLGRLGFALSDVDASRWWEVRAIYRSERSALAVICNNEYRRVEVQLMRLVDGELPAYPIFVVDSVPVNTFYGDDLVVLRRADADQVLAHQHGLSPEDVEAQLAFWSSALREYGQDFLTGNLSVLDTLERIVRDRAHHHHQEVVVWIPDSSSPGDQTRTVERVHTTVPEGVTVTTRRYRSRRHLR